MKRNGCSSACVGSCVRACVRVYAREFRYSLSIITTHFCIFGRAKTFDVTFNCDICITVIYTVNNTVNLQHAAHIPKHSQTGRYDYPVLYCINDSHVDR